MLPSEASALLCSPVTDLQSFAYFMQSLEGMDLASVSSVADEVHQWHERVESGTSAAFVGRVRSALRDVTRAPSPLSDEIESSSDDELEAFADELEESLSELPPRVPSSGTLAGPCTPKDLLHAHRGAFRALLTDVVLEDLGYEVARSLAATAQRWKLSQSDFHRLVASSKVNMDRLFFVIDCASPLGSCAAHEGHVWRHIPLRVANVGAWESEVEALAAEASARTSLLSYYEHAEGASACLREFVRGAASAERDASACETLRRACAAGLEACRACGWQLEPVRERLQHGTSTSVSIVELGGAEAPSTELGSALQTIATAADALELADLWSDVSRERGIFDALMADCGVIEKRERTEGDAEREDATARRRVAREWSRGWRCDRLRTLANALESSNRSLLRPLMWASKGQGLWSARSGSPPHALPSLAHEPHSGHAGEGASLIARGVAPAMSSSEIFVGGVFRPGSSGPERVRLLPPQVAYARLDARRNWELTPVPAFVDRLAYHRPLPERLLARDPERMARAVLSDWVRRDGSLSAADEWAALARLIAEASEWELLPPNDDGRMRPFGTMSGALPGTIDAHRLLGVEQPPLLEAHLALGLPQGPEVSWSAINAYERACWLRAFCGARGRWLRKRGTGRWAIALMGNDASFDSETSGVFAQRAAVPQGRLAWVRAEVPATIEAAEAWARFEPSANRRVCALAVPGGALLVARLGVTVPADSPHAADLALAALRSEGGRLLPSDGAKHRPTWIEAIEVINARIAEDHADALEELTRLSDTAPSLRVESPSDTGFSPLMCVDTPRYGALAAFVTERVARSEAARVGALGPPPRLPGGAFDASEPTWRTAMARAIAEARRVLVDGLTEEAYEAWRLAYAVPHVGAAQLHVPQPQRGRARNRGAANRQTGTVRSTLFLSGRVEEGFVPLPLDESVYELLGEHVRWRNAPLTARQNDPYCSPQVEIANPSRVCGARVVFPTFLAAIRFRPDLPVLSGDLLFLPRALHLGAKTARSPQGNEVASLEAAQERMRWLHCQWAPRVAEAFSFGRKTELAVHPRTHALVKYMVDGAENDPRSGWARHRVSRAADAHACPERDAEWPFFDHGWPAAYQAGPSAWDMRCALPAAARDLSRGRPKPAPHPPVPAHVGGGGVETIGDGLRALTAGGRRAAAKAIAAALAPVLGLEGDVVASLSGAGAATARAALARWLDHGDAPLRIIVPAAWATSGQVRFRGKAYARSVSLGRELALVESGDTRRPRPPATARADKAFTDGAPLARLKALCRKGTSQGALYWIAAVQAKDASAAEAAFARAIGNAPPVTTKPGADPSSAPGRSAYEMWVVEEANTGLADAIAEIAGQNDEWARVLQERPLRVRANHATMDKVRSALGFAAEAHLVGMAQRGATSDDLQALLWHFESLLRSGFLARCQAPCVAGQDGAWARAYGCVRAVASLNTRAWDESPLKAQVTTGRPGLGGRAARIVMATQAQMNAATERLKKSARDSLVLELAEGHTCIRPSVVQAALDQTARNEEEEEPSPRASKAEKEENMPYFEPALKPQHDNNLAPAVYATVEITDATGSGARPIECACVCAGEVDAEHVAFVVDPPQPLKKTTHPTWTARIEIHAAQSGGLVTDRATLKPKSKSATQIELINTGRKRGHGAVFGAHAQINQESEIVRFVVYVRSSWPGALLPPAHKRTKIN